MAKDDGAGFKKSRRAKGGGPGGAVYFFGFIGALVFYIHVHSGTFWLVVLAFLKAIVWPALLIYHLLLFLRM